MSGKRYRIRSISLAQTTPGKTPGPMSLEEFNEKYRGDGISERKGFSANSWFWNHVGLDVETMAVGTTKSRCAFKDCAVYILDGIEEERAPSYDSLSDQEKMGFYSRLSDAEGFKPTLPCMITRSASEVGR